MHDSPATALLASALFSLAARAEFFYTSAAFLDYQQFNRGLIAHKSGRQGVELFHDYLSVAPGAPTRPSADR